LQKFYFNSKKDTLTGYPGNYTTVEINGHKYRWAGCSGGCSYELAFQLGFTMVGKQFMNNCLEVLIPVIIKCHTNWKKVN
jgi:hypothetical protein